MLTLTIPISASLNYLCNHSLLRGTFTDRLKNAIVSPLFNKGSSGEFTNSRQISLLPVISKIFEKKIYTKESTFITTLNSMTLWLVL